MSRQYQVKQITRCPMCYCGGTPAHIGLGVMVCQGCGAHFRVVHAEKGNTGMKLGDIVSSTAVWGQKERSR